MLLRLIAAAWAADAGIQKNSWIGGKNTNNFEWRNRSDHENIKSYEKYVLFIKGISEAKEQKLVFLACYSSGAIRKPIIGKKGES